jgi:hypothetical protein
MIATLREFLGRVRGDCGREEARGSYSRITNPARIGWKASRLARNRARDPAEQGATLAISSDDVEVTTV